MSDNNYDDIINKSRPASIRHKKMSVHDRAAQFSPFAALTGYDAAITETARLTDDKIELDEATISQLNIKCAILRKELNSKTYNINDEKYKVTISYFVADELKSGGRYETYSGYIRAIDEYNRNVIMYDGKSISIDNISDITGELFNCNN